MDSAEITRQIEEINAMSHEAMCRLWRFAPPGHPWFRNDLPFFQVFNERLQSLGGFTPEISKRIGWGKL